MKQKQWLAFIMSVLLVVCSIPVDVVAVENDKTMEEQNIGEDEAEESILEEQFDDKETEPLETQINEEQVFVRSDISEVGLEQSTETESESRTEEITDSDIASGKYGDISWRINTKGKLTVTGSGEFAEVYNIGGGQDYRAPWSKYAESIISAEISIKNITNLSYMFANCNNITNIDLRGLDTNSVTDMHGMFTNCSNLKSVDLSSINTSNVTDMSDMFRCCIMLDSIDVSNFDTGNVKDMNCMFYQCWALKDIDVSRFDISNVINISQMFYDCKILENIDVSRFDTSKVMNMRGLFGNCYKLTNIDISGFNTSKVTDMSWMFQACGITKFDLSSFNTSCVTNMSEMFYGCNMTGVDLSTFDTKHVTEMSSMFENCTHLEQLDLSHFDLSNVNKAQNMFGNCSNLTLIKAPKNVRIEILLPYSEELGWYEGDKEITLLPQNLSSSIALTKGERFNSSDNIASGVYEGITWNIDKDGKLTVTGTGEFSAITPENKDAYTTRAPWYEKREHILSATIHVNGMKDASHMFQNCMNLKSINLKDFDTSMLTTMESMFYGCSSLESVELNGFHIDHVTNLAYMFAKCSQLRYVNLSSFHTEQVTKIDGMFYGCSSLGNLDLSSFTLSHVRKIEDMFTAANNLSVIHSPINIVAKVTLPVSDGYTWTYNESEITTLPQNLGVSVQLTRVPVKSPEESAPPEIITTDLENAVQNVPYELKLQNNGWDSANYQISSGVLPKGINLRDNGTIYGITKETGIFQFTVVMEVKGHTISAEKVLELQVLNSSDRVVDAIDEPGYEIIQPIPDINIEKEIADQLFISNGPFNEFQDAYVDGDKLIRDIDYTAEAGSTRITIRAETLERLEVGKHTLGIEFRTEEGTLKRIAQNFNVSSVKSKHKSNLNNENSLSNDTHFEQFVYF